MDDKSKIKELAEENAKLKEELQATKEHLKKYTAPASSNAILDFYWEEGTHYYEPLSGEFGATRKEFIKNAQHPMPNMLVVGEMISTHQGWVEGALESVENVVTNKWING